ncbi:hypothetical protein OC707_01825, partial ['Opuntia sp.' phytoplasma]
NQTLKFCEIIGFLQDLSKKQIDDFVDNYYSLYSNDLSKIKNKYLIISISQTPLIRELFLLIILLKPRYKDIVILRAIGACKMYILSILIEIVIFLINLSLALILIKFF